MKLLLLLLLFQTAPIHKYLYMARNGGTWAWKSTDGVCAVMTTNNDGSVWTVTHLTATKIFPTKTVAEAYGDSVCPNSDTGWNQ